MLTAARITAVEVSLCVLEEATVKYQRASYCYYYAFSRTSYKCIVTSVSYARLLSIGTML